VNVFRFRFMLAALAALAPATVFAGEDVKVPPAIEQVLAKALVPSQTLGPTRIPIGSATGDFGYSIAVSDKYAVIGSPADTVSGGGSNQNGSVYIFQRVNSATTPWKLLDRLTPGTTTAERFGQSVAVSGELVLVGAPGLKGLTGTGRAILYGRDARRTTTPYFMVLDSTIRGADAGITNAGAAFGESVGLLVQTVKNFISGTSTTTTHVFVGAPQAITQNPGGGANLRTGAVVVYRCVVGKSIFPNPPTYNCLTGGSSGTTLLPKLYRQTTTGGSVDFGQSLAVHGSPKGGPITLVVGSPDQCSNNDLCLVFTIPPAPPPPPREAGVAYVFKGSGNSWGTAATLFPGTGSLTGDDFGDSVAFNGTHVAVGAPRDDINGGTDVGTVRVYENTSTQPCGLSGQPVCTWALVQALVPNNTTTDPMMFGQRVSFYGNQLLVGAPNRTVGVNTLQGSAFYFERSNAQFFLREEIFRTGVTGDTRYGSAVAVLGGSLLIGEKDGPNGGASPQGRVYTYSLSPGISRNFNPAPVANAPQDRFGTTTVVRDGIMLVGVPGAENGALQNVGLVRVLVPNPALPGTWMEVKTFTPPVGEAIANLRFGHALALTANGSRILVGAPGADAVPGDGSVVPVGAVFVYERVAGMTDWVPAVQGSPKLVHASPQLNADFGAAIDVDPAGNLLVVGAPLADRNGMADLGAVTVFRDLLPASGVSDPKLHGKATYGVGEDVPPPAGGGLGDKWGSSVASDGEVVAAGAPEAGGGSGEDGYVTVIDDGDGSFGVEDTVEPPPDAPDTPSDEQDFGTSIDLDEGMLAVGAPGTDVSDEDASTANVDEGAGYAYAVSGNPPQASEPAEMEAPSGEPGDKWGTAVSADGGMVAAGGPGADVPPDEGAPPAGCTTDMCQDQGAVTTYECDVVGGVVICGYDDTIYGKDAAADEGIGTSVALDGETLVTGAPDAGAGDEGAIYAAEDQFLTDGVFRDGFE